MTPVAVTEMPASAFPNCVCQLSSAVDALDIGFQRTLIFTPSLSSFRKALRRYLTAYGASTGRSNSPVPPWWIGSTSSLWGSKTRSVWTVGSRATKSGERQSASGDCAQYTPKLQSRGRVVGDASCSNTVASIPAYSQLSNPTSSFGWESGATNEPS